MSRLAIIIAAFAVSACGFSPVYSGPAKPSSVAVDDIPGRSGHELRKALIQELSAGLPGVDSARLNVDLDEDLNRLTLRPDFSAARTDIVARGKYVLVLDEETISGSAKSETSYNVPDAPYGDIAAQTDAYKRAMRKLAREIVDDIRLKLAAKQ